MLSNSHKIIANNVYEDLFSIHNIKLNKDKLLWGSIAPDILPKYRLIRHYQKESLDYIVNKIVDLIQMGININFDSSRDYLQILSFSRELGIVSHYLTDFVTMPHAKRWTFNVAMKAHVEYERKLDKHMRTYEFKNNAIFANSIDLLDSPENLHKNVKNYIANVSEEYSIFHGFDNDLEYASDLNVKMSDFILSTIKEYKRDSQYSLVLSTM